MFFRMQDRKGVIPESQHGGQRGGVRIFPAENDPLVAEVEAVKKAKGEMPDSFSVWGGCEGDRPVHVRRMREISGREIRWRAR